MSGSSSFSALSGLCTCFRREGDSQNEECKIHKKVLITGATGMLGRQVFRVFVESGWNVKGLGHSRARDPMVKCDLLQHGEVEAQIKDFRPAVVIHCAAERRPDRLQGRVDYAMKINCEVTRNLAEICDEYGIWMIYISTNYVFDGRDAPYSVDATPNPLSTYGESKLDGEKALLHVQPGSAVLRVPLLFGPLEYLGESSVTALLDSITKKADPKFDNWQERFPTSSDDLADVLEAFAAAYVARGHSSPSEFGGIFHWQANERQTKYTMAVTIAEIAGLPINKFIRVDTGPAEGAPMRPQFECMECTRLEKVLGIEGDAAKYRTDFREAVSCYIKPFLEKEVSENEDDDDTSACFPSERHVSEREVSGESLPRRNNSTNSILSVGSKSKKRISLNGDLNALRDVINGTLDPSKSFAQRFFEDEKAQKICEDHAHHPVAIDG